MPDLMRSFINWDSRHGRHSIRHCFPHKKQGIYDPSILRGRVVTPIPVRFCGGFGNNVCITSGSCRVWWKTASLCRSPAIPAFTGKSFSPAEPFRSLHRKSHRMSYNYWYPVLKIHACCSVPVSFAWSRA